MKRAAKERKMPRHWYRIIVSECPFCGAGKEYRERVYGKPPADPADRYVYDWSGCAQGGACYSWL